MGRLETLATSCPFEQVVPWHKGKLNFGALCHPEGKLILNSRASPLAHPHPRSHTHTPTHLSAHPPTDPPTHPPTTRPPTTRPRHSPLAARSYVERQGFAFCVGMHLARTPTGARNLSTRAQEKKISGNLPALRHCAPKISDLLPF